MRTIRTDWRPIALGFGIAALALGLIGLCTTLFADELAIPPSGSAPVLMSELGTGLDSLHLLRAEADEDAATIDLTTEGDFDQMPDSAVDLYNLANAQAYQMRGGAIGVMAHAGAAADKTFTVVLYGWRSVNGPCQRIASIACTTGTQAVVTYPVSGATATNKFWADTMTVTCYRGAGSQSSDAAGGNGAAECSIDLAGIRYVYAEVTGADGVTGAEAGDVTVYFYQW